MQFITTGNRIAVENFTIGDLYTITFTNGNYINSACIGIGGNFVTFQRNEPELLFSLTMETAELVSTIDLYAGGSGTTNYNELTNKPQINSVELVGNKSLAALGIQPEITEESPLSSALVSGLGSAAAAESSDFATAAQGALAASAVQPADLTAALALKQDALSSAQLEAVNSGIASADVAQITTNKNNILLNARNGVANVLANNAVTTTAANGLTYTVNADKSITVTGNSTAYNAFTVAGSRTYANAMPLKRGTYIIKAGIAYDSSKPIYVQFGVMTSSGASISWQNIYDTNKELVVDNDTTRIVYELYNPSGSYSGYNATFYPMIIDKSLYEAGFTDYQPYALSNAELTAGKADLAKTVMRGDTYVANTTKTYTLTAAKTYLISIVCYNVAGLFLAFKYSTESTPRLFPVYKTADFDNYATVSAVADSSNIQISSASSSTWYYSNIAML